MHKRQYVSVAFPLSKKSFFGGWGLGVGEEHFFQGSSEKVINNQMLMVMV